MNLKEILKRMSYEERIEFITHEIQYYEDLKIECNNDNKSPLQNIEQKKQVCNPLPL